MDSYFHENFLGFCKRYKPEKRKKRDLQQRDLYTETETHMTKRLKREDIITEENILKRSYKAKLG